MNRSSVVFRLGGWLSAAAAAVVDALHRIDPAIVRRDFARAGFAFEPGIRGKTDQFVYRFRRPGP